MYPAGLLSTLLPDQQKKLVNRYDYQRFEQQERIGMASYHQAKLHGGMQPSGKGMRFYPQLHVEFTLPDPMLKNSKAKPRLKWDHELQDRFIRSVDALGGEKYATPKKILHMMNATGLTLSHLKSHLQKYRIALKAPPRRPRVNPKKKTSSPTASSGRRGSSSFTKRSGANKWNAESSKARKQNGNKPLKIQAVEMGVEGKSKTGGNPAIVASPSASTKGKKSAIPTFENQAIIAPAFASSKGKEPAIQTTGNQIIGAFALVSKGKDPAIRTMGNEIIGASAFTSSKEKEPAIQTMGNQIIGASAFASSNGEEPDIDFETNPYPLPPSIFDIQFENYYPVHYLREEVIVQTRNVAGASVKEQVAFYQPLGQASISRNLAYLNHSTPHSNSSFGLAGGSRTIFANYQMNTSSSFSSLFGDPINTGSSFSSAYDNVKTGSSISSTFSNMMDTDSSLSLMFWNSTHPGSSFSPLVPNPMELGSSFPSMIANLMGPGSSFSSVVINLMGPGSSFSPMVPNPMEPGSSLPSLMIANPMGSGSSFSPMVANPTTEPGSSFSSVVTNPLGPSSSFSSMVADPTFEVSVDTAGSSLSSTVGNSMDTGFTSSVPGDSMDPGRSSPTWMRMV